MTQQLGKNQSVVQILRTCCSNFSRKNTILISVNEFTMLEYSVILCNILLKSIKLQKIVTYFDMYLKYVFDYSVKQSTYYLIQMLSNNFNYFKKLFKTLINQLIQFFISISQFALILQSIFTPYHLYNYKLHINSFLFQGRA